MRHYLTTPPGTNISLRITNPLLIVLTVLATTTRRRRFVARDPLFIGGEKKRKVFIPSRPFFCSAPSEFSLGRPSRPGAVALGGGWGWSCYYSPTGSNRSGTSLPRLRRRPRDGPRSRRLLLSVTTGIKGDDTVIVGGPHRGEVSFVEQRVYYLRVAVATGLTVKLGSMYSNPRLGSSGWSGLSGWHGRARI